MPKKRFYMVKNLMNGWVRGLIVTLITGAVISITFFILTPQNIPTLHTHALSAQSYKDALQRVAALRADEGQNMNPVSRLQLMTHQKKTERAIILVHGYTSSPQQFHQLGLQLYDAGYNVLIAPLPHHGLADRMTQEHAKLTAEELAAYTDRTVNIARGLGKQVVMMGISTGGVMTAWAAQNRSDIDLAVIISPAFGFNKIPTFLTAAAMNIYGFLPDIFEWWNPDLKEKEPPAYSYPRYSRHALVEILRLGFAVRTDASKKPPAAKKMVFIFNANDTTINHELEKEMATIWQSYHAKLTTYEFPAALKLRHDMIDPAKSGQRTDIVYPRLMELIKE